LVVLLMVVGRDVLLLALLLRGMIAMVRRGGGR
jgi:hypothetical protein